MLQTFDELKEFFDTNDPDIVLIYPSVGELYQLENLLDTLKTLDSITIKLQGEDIDLGDVRLLFDGVNKKFPEMARYLAPDSNIVHSKEFETTVAKLCISPEATLNDVQATMVKPFRHHDPDGCQVIQEVSTSFAEQLLMPKRQRQTSANYNVKWLPATANRVERLFSRAKLTVGDLKASMTPLNLEGLLFLHANKRFWDESVIQFLLN